MAYKWVGSMLLFVAAACFSYNRIAVNRRKIEFLHELCAYFAFAEKQIDCFQTPLARIAHAYKIQNTESIRLNECGFLDGWEKGEPAQAIRGFQKMLSPAVYSVLETYSRNAGNGYKEAELRLCRYTLETIEQAEKTMREAFLQKKRMYGTLPYVLAFSIVLLLL